ncbi:ATP-binding protein, partial [Streptomyces sp. NPDC001193]
QELLGAEAPSAADALGGSRATSWGTGDGGAMPPLEPVRVAVPQPMPQPRAPRAPQAPRAPEPAARAWAAPPPAPVPPVPPATVVASVPSARTDPDRPILPRRRAQHHVAPQLRDAPAPRPADTPEQPVHDPGLMAAFQRGFGLAQSENQP